MKVKNDNLKAVMLGKNKGYIENTVGEKQKFDKVVIDSRKNFIAVKLKKKKRKLKMMMVFETCEQEYSCNVSGKYTNVDVLKYSAHGSMRSIILAVYNALEMEIISLQVYTNYMSVRMSILYIGDYKEVRAIENNSQVATIYFDDGTMEKKCM